MHRSLSLRAVICLSTLLPASALYAAPDTDIETLKQELLELKQRYEVQQKSTGSIGATRSTGRRPTRNTRP